MINYELLNESTTKFRYLDNDGCKWAAYSLMSTGAHKGLDYPVKTPSGKVVRTPKDTHWRYSENSLKQLIKENMIWFGQHGDSVPRLKKYLDEVYHKKT